MAADAAAAAAAAAARMLGKLGLDVESIEPDENPTFESDDEEEEAMAVLWLPFAML